VQIGLLVQRQKRRVCADWDGTVMEQRGATDGKGRVGQIPEIASNEQKALPLAATGCRLDRMVRRRSIRERNSIPHRSRSVCQLGNVPSRAHPARGRRRSPPAPANPRNGPSRKALLSPVISTYPRSTRKHHDRPVSPEVAGSSPVAPVSQSACRQVLWLIRRGHGPVGPFRGPMQEAGALPSGAKSGGVVDATGTEE
jgi:hypothetical protein